MDQEATIQTSRQWPQYLATLSAALLSMSCGLHFGWPTPAIPKLLDGELGFNVNKQEVSTAVILSPLAYLIGSPVSGFLLDKIGRKAAILVLAFPQILAWLLIANLTGLPMLYVARFTAGLSEGGAITTIPLYVGEIAEPKIRGILGTVFTMALIFGRLIFICYGSFMSIKASAYISICLPVIFLMIFIWMPESPYYFLMKGQQEKARNSLKKLRRMNNVEEELMKLEKDVQRQMSEPNSIKHIFTIKSNLRAFLIVAGLRTLQQFSGGAAINFYIQLIFKESRANLSYITASIIYSVTLFMVSVIGSPLGDRYGRKPILLISTFGTGCCVLIEGIYFYFLHLEYNLSRFSWIPLTVLVAYTIVRGIGIMPIPTVIAGELFSASIKAKAAGIINLYLAFCFAASSQLFEVLEDALGMEVPFLLFAVVSYSGLLFIAWCVPETKGKTLEEIQQILKGNVDN